MATEASTKMNDGGVGDTIYGWQSVHEKHREELCRKLGGTYCS
jgi:hypothetical protein